LSLALLLFASFYLPLNSEKVEDWLGLDPYVATSEAETGVTESPDEDLQLDEALQRLDEDFQYEESADEFYEEGGDEFNEYNADEEEDEYINPYLFIPAAVLLLLNLVLWPYFDFISNRFLARNARFGAAKWRYTATAGQYYAVYAKFLLITLGFVLAGAVIIMGDFGEGVQIMLAILLSLLYFPAASAYLKSRRYNLLFNNIEIEGGYKLQAGIPFRRFFLLVITNSLAVTLTFGLMAAWAKIRTAALMLEYTTLVTTGSLDKFVAEQQKENSALAEEIGDVFDVELGI
jgi:uncharacterized membrane protein YjgN (DUF898 family)